MAVPESLQESGSSPGSFEGVYEITPERLGLLTQRMQNHTYR